MEASSLASSSPSAGAASSSQAPSRQRSLRQRNPSRTTRQSSLASSAGAKGTDSALAQGGAGATPRKRHRKDRHAAALESIRDFLKGRSCYDGLPVSFRLIVLDTKLIVKPALEVMWQAGVVSAPLWHSTTLPDTTDASTAAAADSSLSSSMLLSDPASASTPGSALSKLPPRQALKPGFAGMLTVNDIIHLIQYYYRHSSYDNAAQDVEHFRLEMLRDIERALGVPQPPLLSVSPLRPLYEACQLLIKTHARRLPLLDYDEQTGIETVLSVLTQYRVLKFIAMNCTETAGLQRSVKSLGIGTYTKATSGVGSAREAAPRTPASRSGSGSGSGSASGGASGSGSGIAGTTSPRHPQPDTVEALLQQNPNFQGLSIAEGATSSSSAAVDAGSVTPDKAQGAEGISPRDPSVLQKVAAAGVEGEGEGAPAPSGEDPDATPGLTADRQLGMEPSAAPTSIEEGSTADDAAMLASPVSEPAGSSAGLSIGASMSGVSKGGATAATTATAPTSPFAALYEPLYTATLDTTVFDVVHVFSERGISAVPILDEEGYAVDMYETVDVIDLVRSGMYQSLDLTIRQALARRPADFAGVMSCSPDDSLASIFALLRTRRVHRLLVLEPEEEERADGASNKEEEGGDKGSWPAREGQGAKADAASSPTASSSQYRERGRGRLVGILCLSDILKYLIGTMEKEDAELAAKEEARRKGGATLAGPTSGSTAGGAPPGSGRFGVANVDRSRTGSQGSQASSAAAPLSSTYGSFGAAAAPVAAVAGAASTTAIVSEDEDGGGATKSQNASASSLAAAAAAAAAGGGGNEASNEAEGGGGQTGSAGAAAATGTRPSELAEPQPTIPEDEVLDLQEIAKQGDEEEVGLGSGAKSQPEADEDGSREEQTDALVEGAGDEALVAQTEQQQSVEESAETTGEGKGEEG